MMDVGTASGQTTQGNDAIVEIGGKDIELLMYTPPKFDVTDPAGYKYFKDFGYVVFKDVATPEELAQGKELFWKYMSHCFPNVDRNDEKTWVNSNWPNWTGNGIIMADGIGNSEFTWFCRGIAKVKQIYSTIWNGEEDLLVSMDAAGVTRPPEYNPDYTTLGGWFHFDQNGYQKKGFHCAQGLLNFLPSGPQDGGLTLIPKTHALFDLIFGTRAGLGDRFGSDYVRITKPELMPEVWHDPSYRPIKLCLDPGDFAVWDSRTAHCNHPATPQPTPPPTPSIRRLVCYICMTPVKQATNRDKVINKRLTGFRAGMTTSHWPHDYQPRGSKNTKQPEFFLNEQQKELLLGKQFASTLPAGPLSSKPPAAPAPPAPAV